MAERMQTLRRKLRGCAKKVSDEEVSECMHKMLIASETLPDSFFAYAEWKGNSDDSVAKVYSNIINLVQVVEDVVDLYYFLMSKPKSSKTGSSNNELREISAKMLQFLQEDENFYHRF
ncbi:hypothetical protein L6164_025918 [Bauhinia variegata]|uniref:Uncharacterized protein n=1 Tax=Bauhinia variegata TaxID=167791 RepID=A0ACB9M5Q7_BAUVA|nr:hypothetical protein L6164_025918 [Bauhinia variegata]